MILNDHIKVAVNGQVSYSDAVNDTLEVKVL